MAFKAVPTQLSELLMQRIAPQRREAPEVQQDPPIEKERPIELPSMVVEQGTKNAPARGGLRGWTVSFTGTSLQVTAGGDGRTGGQATGFQQIELKKSAGGKNSRLTIILIEGD